VTGWRAKMLLGSGLWMRSQKTVEHVDKGQNMLLVVIAWLARMSSTIMSRIFSVPCSWYVLAHRGIAAYREETVGGRYGRSSNSGH
jgi:hypothetical protein